jgi:hypothetical protein
MQQGRGDADKEIKGRTVLPSALLGVETFRRLSV